MGEPIEVHVFGGKKGESIAVRLPGEVWGVVDNYTPNLATPQSNPTLRFLESRNVARLKFVCLTHPHADHYRGMHYLLQRYNPECVWLFGAATHRDLYSKVADVLKVSAASTDHLGDQSESVEELVQILDWVRDQHENRGRVPRLDVRRLQLEMPLLELNTTPPIRMTAIGASGGRATVYEGTLASCFDARGNFLLARLPTVNHNVISGGVLIEYGNARIILGADIDSEAWEETLRRLASSGRLRAHLVKVSHHGSETGYCAGLWNELSPSKIATAVLTPFSSQGLPSPEGLAHIFAHARQTLTTSIRAVELSRDWGDAGVETAFQGVSAEALVTLRTLFRKATPASERLEGRCSFSIHEDGTVTPSFAGEAGRLNGV